MSLNIDKIKIGDRTLKRSCKLSIDNITQIKQLYEDNNSINGISKLFNVSKRLVQFILFPDRHIISLQLRKERGGSKIYYDKDKHTVSNKDYRNYKRKLLKEGIINDDKGSNK